MKKILITGSCGFIGFHLSKKLCDAGYNVVGIDNLKSSDKQLQNDRLKILKKLKHFQFKKIDLVKKFNRQIKDKFYAIIHLAAKPGVRESQKNPEIYFKNNIIAFYNIIELAKKNTQLFLYASSSSVYGDNQSINIGSDEKITKINSLSFYALTKEIDEKLAHYYSLNGLKCFGMRFFSVYGDYGRPDMAYYKFPYNALKNKKIFLNNKGDDFRDFTHVDDVTSGIQKLIEKAYKIKKSDIFNFGSNKPIKVKEILKLIKSHTNLNLRIIHRKKNKLDPNITNANIKNAKKKFGYTNNVKFDVGYVKFLKWFSNYHKK